MATIINALPQETDFNIMQDSTFICNISVLDTYGIALDLTGYDIQAEFKRAYNGSAVITANIANGSIKVSSPITGNITLTLLPTDTAPISPVNQSDDTIELLYDISLISSTTPQVILTPTFGTLTIQRKITI